MTETKPLSAEQVKKWATAEVEVEQAQAELEKKRARAKELRERYAHRMHPSDDPNDAGKDVHVAEGAGWRIRLARFADGDRFSLKSYREAGYRVTERMAEHITSGRQKQRVTAKRIDGPTRPGAVEPS